MMAVDQRYRQVVWFKAQKRTREAFIVVHIVWYTTEAVGPLCMFVSGKWSRKNNIGKFWNKQLISVATCSQKNIRHIMSGKLWIELCLVSRNTFAQINVSFIVGIFTSFNRSEWMASLDSKYAVCLRFFQMFQMLLYDYFNPYFFSCMRHA